MEMAKILRCRLVLSITLLVFCAAPSNIAAQGDSRWLVSPKLLAGSNLEILWQNELPIKKTESLEQLFILGNRIYGLSDHNYLVSLNRKKGNMMFSTALAPAGSPLACLELYRDALISIVGNRLIEINPESGMQLSSIRLAVSATAPAVRNSSYFYIPGTDKCVHALRAEDKVQVFEIAAGNNSMITSIVADEDFVIFATDTGSCISIRPDAPKQLWQFDAAGGIARPIVRDRKSLFIASEDTNVYRIDILTGELVWRYQAGAVLDRGPVVTEGVVYQYIRDKGLVAIDKKSGNVLWQLPEGIDLLAQSQGKAYVITNSGNMIVMDNNKTKQLYSINLAGVSKYATNVADAKIYIADKAGRIACLKPVE